MPRRESDQRGGRLPSLGQDHHEGHRRYAERIGERGELWLRAKPFSADPGHELVECLRMYSHIVARLGLPRRAQVLDVGCGPGWLSEFLVRCGYAVTGVDVSEDMVRIARERIAAIEKPISGGIEPSAEFHAMPVRELPWKQRFDAALLYDAMHHFDDELETLRVIRGALAPGGRIFIHEGVRPEPGSEGERQLVAEMKEYGTLESPFDPDYLVEVLDRAGFTQITRFAAVDDLLDVSQTARELQRIEARLANPPMNTVIAVNPMQFEMSRDVHDFRAQIEVAGALRRSPDGDARILSIAVTNAGRGFWFAATDPWFPLGTVTIGPYFRAADRSRIELPRVPLPRSLSPGDSIEVEIRIPVESLEKNREVSVDLVRAGISWFEDYGSPQLVVPLPNED